MGPGETTAATPDPTRGADAAAARHRFSADLDAGLSPRIEDYLGATADVTEDATLRPLIVAELEWRRARGDRPDCGEYLVRFPAHGDLVRAIFGDGETTLTRFRRNPAETDEGLAFGLLAMGIGLVDPGSLTLAIDEWAPDPRRPIRQILVDRGDLDEATAALLDALADRLRRKHGGDPARALAALGPTARGRLDPGAIRDAEIREILRRLVGGDGRPEDPATPTGLGEPTGNSRRYRILRHHARGGLGVVHLALDEELHREVALKEIQPRCADHHEYRARFLREAEVTGRLEHPGIVPVYGIGNHPDGRPYYVMRFIRGETLKDAIARLHGPDPTALPSAQEEDRRRFELHALVGRFADACLAIAYAHSRKVIHRDLKPGNIMLGPYGETLVVDWGLAKTSDAVDGPESGEEGTLRPESDSQVTPTTVGSEVGTVGYMSPEQSAGRVGELGPASDVYSLGATLHCLVAGHPPFDGAGREEFRKRVREGDFPRPGQINPTVPAALEAICLKAMALRPVDRYASAQAMADDLERWRADRPVLAYPEPPVVRLARWARGHKAPLAAAAALLVSVTIGLLGYSVQARRENIRVGGERAAALAMLKYFAEELAGPDLAYIPNTAPIRTRIVDKVLGFHRDLYRRHPADPEVRSELAEVCRLAANIGRTMGRFDGPQGLYAESIRLLESTEGGRIDLDRLRLLLSSARHDAGENLRMAGKPRAAEAEFLKALDDLKRPGSAPLDTPEARRKQAQILLDLASARLETGRPAEAKFASRKAVELLLPLADDPRAQPVDRLLLIRCLACRACSDHDLGHHQGASDDLNEAGRWARELNMNSRINLDAPFTLAMVRNLQGQIALDRKRPAEAVGAFEEAVSILMVLLPKNPDLPFYQDQMGMALNGRSACRLAEGRLDDALADGNRSRAYFEGLVARWPGHYAYHGQLGRTLGNLGRIALASGKPTEAFGWWRKALPRHQEALRVNSESPEDKMSAAACRAELQKLEP